MPEDPNPYAEEESADPDRCRGAGEIEVPTHQNEFGVWDTETLLCPGCPDCAMSVARGRARRPTDHRPSPLGEGGMMRWTVTRKWLDRWGSLRPPAGSVADSDWVEVVPAADLDRLAEALRAALDAETWEQEWAWPGMARAALASLEADQSKETV